MENSYSSAFYYEIPDVDIYENQLVGRGGEPAAPTEDLGTLESSRTMDMLFTKRDIPEALEEEEESKGPPGGQDLKDAYIQLIQGVQEWQDGCVYRGDFGLDMKLGHGEFSWPTGESYRGQFYRDHRHGLGTYLWPDGSSFTGMFYLSYREGYGTMYQKTRLFQGLYKANERFGPGIETYPDGSQDVGLWFREHLIKLCTEVPSSFSIHDYPEYSGFLTHSPARISLLGEEKMEWDLHEERDPFFYDYKRFLLNDDLTLPPEMHIYSTDNSHLPMTCSFRKELDALIFLNDIPPFVEDGEPWFIKNETPLMVKIQKQAYKYRNKKAHSSWNMGAILEGDRRSFACSGPKERLAKDMILRAGEGDYDWIYGILRDDLASANVADAKGYTVLAAAAVHCHNDIINLLLDHGADVNKYTDEGLTALSMCFLLYYPSRCFKPNIAERTAPKPQEASNMPVNPNHAFSFLEVAKESVYLEELVPIPGSQEQKSAAGGDEEDGLSAGTQLSQESPNLGGNPPKSDRLSSQGSVSDLEKGLDCVVGSLDGHRLGSQETNIESGICVRNYSITLSQDLLRKSAQAYSMLKASSLSTTGPVKGTMRKVALAMIERRSRWLTIRLLLHRGADPNLCRVPMQALFFAVKAGDVAGVKLLLENRARTDIQLPPELGALTPLHVAAALPGEEGVKITELLLHAATDVDARAADQDDVYKLGKLDLLPSSLKLNHEAGPASIYYSKPTSVPDEGGRTALHVACEREDNYKIDRLIDCGADILSPVTLTQGDRMAVGTAVDYGYFKFYQDRKIAHCPCHMLTPAEREVFLARKRLLEYMGFQLRRAVSAKESQWDPKLLNLSKKAELTPYQMLKRKSAVVSKALHLEEQERIPFFKFCSQCGRSVGVRLVPCTRCYRILTCSKYCKTRAWGDFHKQDCGPLSVIGKMESALFTQNFQKHLGKKVSQKPETTKLPGRPKSSFSTYNQE
ncbi:ankyrin repeat and MYND domain-containing protein 1 isoform X6 [Zalophus californianus]|uniref:Ankyrin repeat and MYND domain-containing protein 1 isoform X6 n=1 Tax=Zalophus californianus TaxID=9704 RepID=A0A6J2CKE3_ZALCA|nr:ankyrin repeat and MYND domain-containing protein 1 isoform X6 [Zalophus californianus]